MINSARFDEYKHNLKRALSEGNHIKFMQHEENPFKYYEPFKMKDFCYADHTLSEPYYDEVLISEIKFANSDKILDNNYPRVINAINYIVDNQCKPIALIKFNDGYYIENGKHRFFAHILLDREVIPASIRVKDENKSENENFMIDISRPYYNDDGMKLAYPEQAYEFFENTDRCLKMLNR